MWYFTCKTESDQRSRLLMADTREDADASRASLAEEFPDAEISEAFEESYEYQFSFPHIIGYGCTSEDGSDEWFWSDGVKTPKTE